MSFTDRTSLLRIGVDVGDVFTDLVASDGQEVRVLKIPSTPDFHNAVIDAINRAAARSPNGLAGVEIVYSSTVATNALLDATLQSPVEAHLRALAGNDQSDTPRISLQIMSSTGGTLSIAEASVSAGRLVLSGPAGGVAGALLISRAANIDDIITYDMGGASTGVGIIVGGKPQWMSEGVVDGLPIHLPALDIHTVDAGGGSIASLDAGGALRVGPRSAGALPGPACYGRGGLEPTVTDANLLLGRILPDRFAGGTMRVSPDLAARAVEPLAAAMGKRIDDTAADIVRVAEENISREVRAVTSRRGLDSKHLALMSFGGAGGLHACAIAEALDIATVIIPPYCGVLSALGMVAAPPVADAAKTVLHLGEGLDDHRLYAEYGHLNMLASESLPQEDLAAVEAYADVRFKGQSSELTVQARGADRAQLEQSFRDLYAERNGVVQGDAPIEIVTLRLRRIGRVAEVGLPRIKPSAPPAPTCSAGTLHALSREQLLSLGSTNGPLLLIDNEATAYVASGWTATCDERGIITLRHNA